MSHGIAKTPIPTNEPVLDYAPGNAETTALKAKLSEFSNQTIEIPCIINGKAVTTGNTVPVVCPHDHQKHLALYHHAGPKEIELALEGSKRAYQEWSRMPGQDRAAIFLKAAELLATDWRQTLNASTMLGQSKTCHQAEIDAACELIDFFKFNVSFQKQLYEIQPESAPGTWNQLQYRALEGFVFAVSPFNFTSIAINLPSSAALMGNVSIWKPSPTSALSCYYGMKLLEEAGLPPGVIQFLPGEGPPIGDVLLKHPELAGVHFTGSTRTFQTMWKTVGNNISNYRSYPRIVGETGGKDFIFAHESADVEVLTMAILRGAFEYQGQKCSAASRAYIPKGIWKQIKENLISETSKMTMGDVSDFNNFMGAVIDKRSFDKIASYIEDAKASQEADIIVGGEYDDIKGYFIRPTIIETTNPMYKTMREELFGPVLTVYVYDEKDFEGTMDLCESTADYALTGCIIAQDRAIVNQAKAKFEHTAGNFYVNNKPTGAVVGQQPFGGGRASGTNDKAGSIFNLTRWTSMRTISETLAPPKNYRYPFLG